MPDSTGRLGLAGGVFPCPTGTPPAPQHASKAMLSCGECCFFALFFLLKQIHMQLLPFRFVFLSVLEYGYRRHEAFGTGLSLLGSLTAAEGGSKTKSGLCGVMLRVGLVCGFPRQTGACLPTSPPPPKFPVHDSEQGNGHQRKVPNSLFNFVGSVERV